MDREKIRTLIGILIMEVILIPTLLIAAFGGFYMWSVSPASHPFITLLLICDAIALLLVGLFIVIGNFYIGFLRRFLHKWRGGNPHEFKSASLILLLSTFLLATAANTFHWSDHPILMWTAIVIAVLDIGGPLIILLFLTKILSKK